jgi:hypothetical protein
MISVVVSEMNRLSLARVYRDCTWYEILVNDPLFQGWWASLVLCLSKRKRLMKDVQSVCLVWWLSLYVPLVLLPCLARATVYIVLQVQWVPLGFLLVAVSICFAIFACIRSCLQPGLVALLRSRIHILVSFFLLFCSSLLYLHYNTPQHFSTQTSKVNTSITTQSDDYRRYLPSLLFFDAMCFTE